MEPLNVSELSARNLSMANGLRSGRMLDSDLSRLACELRLVLVNARRARLAMAEEAGSDQSALSVVYRTDRSESLAILLAIVTSLKMRTRATVHDLDLTAADSCRLRASPRPQDCVPDPQLKIAQKSLSQRYSGISK